MANGFSYVHIQPVLTSFAFDRTQVENRRRKKKRPNQYARQLAIHFRRIVYWIENIEWNGICCVCVHLYRNLTLAFINSQCDFGIEWHQKQKCLPLRRRQWYIVVIRVTSSSRTNFDRTQWRQNYFHIKTSSTTSYRPTPMNVFGIRSPAYGDALVLCRERSERSYLQIVQKHIPIMDIRK